MEASMPMACARSTGANSNQAGRERDADRLAPQTPTFSCMTNCPPTSSGSATSATRRNCNPTARVGAGPREREARSCRAWSFAAAAAFVDRAVHPHGRLAVGDRAHDDGLVGEACTRAQQPLQLPALAQILKAAESADDLLAHRPI